MNSDLLDEYCRNLYGHTDWQMDTKDGNLVVIFFAEPRADYSENLEIDLDGGLSATNEQESEE